jgi:hypothetical protein
MVISLTDDYNSPIGFTLHVGHLKTMQQPVPNAELNKFMEENGITPAKLAEYSGIDLRTVYRYMNGHGKISAKSAKMFYEGVLKHRGIKFPMTILSSAIKPGAYNRSTIRELIRIHHYLFDRKVALEVLIGTNGCEMVIDRMKDSIEALDKAIFVLRETIEALKRREPGEALKQRETGEDLKR